MVIKKTTGEKLFDMLNYFLLAIAALVTLYPLLYVLFASLSDPVQVISSGAILIWPKGFKPGAYRLVLENPDIATGYLNTVFYVAAGTLLNVTMTSLAAYGLSRKWLYGRNFIMMMITFTMFFSGGLIPQYLLVKGLGIMDTRWAMLLPGAVSAWNIIIMRTYFLGIPESMEESAKIDGANDFIVLFRIMIPLAVPVIAVMVLFYSVGHWNAWFNAMIYLKKRSLFPLQLFLRNILIQSQTQAMTDQAAEPIAENIKYATIMVSTLPVLCIYPFLQKYFVQGMMIGAVKG